MSLWVILGAIAVVGILAWAFVEISRSAHRTKLRREIMAYVAEGAIKPEDAAKLVEIYDNADLRERALNDAEGNLEFLSKFIKDVSGEPKPKKDAAAKA